MKQTSMGVPVRWADSTVELSVIPTGSSNRDRLLLGAAQEAARAWSRTGEVMIHVSTGRAGTKVSATASQDTAGSDGNIVAWGMNKWTEDDDMLAVTYLHYTIDSGDVLDADILVNDAHYRWIDAEATPDDNAYDLANALTHELGHALGLGHSEVVTATMFASSSSMEIAKRDLDDDDEAGLRAVYAEVPDPPESVAAELDSPYGCQDTPHDTPWLVLAAVMLALLAARPARPAHAHATRHPALRRRARSALHLALVAAPLLMVDGAAHATPSLLAIDKIVARADAVADVEVVSQKVELQEGLRVTVSVLRVRSCRAGWCPRTLVLEQLGGELDGIGLVSEGITPVKLGDELTIAARARGARWRLVGRDRGVLLDLRRASPAARAAVDQLVRVAR